MPDRLTEPTRPAASPPSPRRIQRHHARRLGAGVAALSALLTVLALWDQPSGHGLPAPTPASSSGALGSGPGATEARGSGLGPLAVVALGDSVPSATSCGCTGFVELLAAQLATLTGRSFLVHNDATDGWTTADVLAALDAVPTRADLQQADLAVIEIGANDFDLSRLGDPACVPAATSPCWASTMAAMRTRLDRIVRTVQQLDENPRLRVAVVGYWNVTVDGVVGRSRGAAFVRDSDRLTRVVNGVVAEVAASRRATYVDAYTPLKGEDGALDPTGYLLADGDHPNQGGYDVLAQAALEALEAHGAVDAWREG